MRPVFLDVEVGDVVIVNPLYAAPYLSEVISVVLFGHIEDQRLLEGQKREDITTALAGLQQRRLAVVAIGK